MTEERCQLLHLGGQLGNLKLSMCNERKYFRYRVFVTQISPAHNFFLFLLLLTWNIVLRESIESRSRIVCHFLNRVREIFSEVQPLVKKQREQYQARALKTAEIKCRQSVLTLDGLSLYGYDAFWFVCCKLYGMSRSRRDMTGNVATRKGINLIQLVSYFRSIQMYQILLCQSKHPCDRRSVGLVICIIMQ